MTYADRFTPTPGRSYLLSHSIGLPPRGIHADALADHLAVFDADPADAWTHWLAEIDGFRGALARLFGHDAAWFCPQTNVSSGLTKFLGSLPSDRGRPTILMTEDAFPSLGFVGTRSDLDVAFLPADADALDPDVWRRHLTDDVGVVLVTQVHSNTGEAIPVGAVLDVVREHGAIGVVDVAQSAGVLPIDLSEWGAHAVVGSCVKWLCGGPGAGYLWVDPDLASSLAPSDVGWFSHEAPFEFDIHDYRDAPDALRFWGGTPSVLPFAVARRAIDVAVDIGVDVVRARNVELADRLLDGAPEEMVVSPRDVERRSGTVVLDAGDGTDGLVERLAAAGVDVDRRPTGIRVSPHVYNDTDDVDAVLDAL